MLYHSDSLSDAKKFLLLEDSVCEDYARRQLFGEEEDPALNTEQTQLLEQFRLIGRQVSVVLSHMKNRLDGQKTFIDILRDTVQTAQELLDKAIEDKKALLEKQKIEKAEKEKQNAELALMTKAEAETRAFLAAEKSQKEEEEKKGNESTAASTSESKKGPKVGKVKSAIPSKG